MESSIMNYKVIESLLDKTGTSNICFSLKKQFEKLFTKQIFGFFVILKQQSKKYSVERVI